MKTPISHKPHWLDIAEITAVTGSIGGSVASVFFKQFLWATIPLSVTAGLAIVNHQRLKQMVESKQEEVAALIAENQARITKLKQQSEKQHWDNNVEFKEIKQANEQVSEKLDELDTEQRAKLERADRELQTLQASMTRLDELTSKLEQEQNETRKMAGELKAIEKFTQIINRNPNAAQAYYHRGSAYQRSGNTERAIEDFSQAISLCEDHAKAYHKRGLLYLEVDRPQEAVIDFRRASQYFIAKGDLDKYREARDLSLKIHFDRADRDDEDVRAESDRGAKSGASPIAVSNVFG